MSLPAGFLLEVRRQPDRPESRLQVQQPRHGHSVTVAQPDDSHSGRRWRPQHAVQTQRKLVSHSQLKIVMF